MRSKADPTRPMRLVKSTNRHAPLRRTSRRNLGRHVIRSRDRPRVGDEECFLRRIDGSGPGEIEGTRRKAVAPENTINYVASVGKNLGGRQDDWASFPCILVAWVEEGKAPETLLASHPAQAGGSPRTRPLCQYPMVAKYKGTGSTDDAASFTCS